MLCFPDVLSPVPPKRCNNWEWGWTRKEQRNKSLKCWQKAKQQLFFLICFSSCFFKCGSVDGAKERNAGSFFTFSSENLLSCTIHSPRLAFVHGRLPLHQFQKQRRPLYSFVALWRWSPFFDFCSKLPQSWNDQRTSHLSQQFSENFQLKKQKSMDCIGMMW